MAVNLIVFNMNNLMLRTEYSSSHQLTAATRSRRGHCKICMVIELVCTEQQLTTL